MIDEHNRVDYCRLCLSLTGPTYGDLERQLIQANPWADLIEIRLDLLETLDFKTLRHLQQQATCPLIWTLRSEAQGGKFAGDSDASFAILRIIAAWEPDWMDVEASMPVSLIQALQGLSRKTQWIVSWHDKKETPSDLNQLFESLMAIPANYYKIATLAHSTTDALRMLHLSKQANAIDCRLCALCMGEKGQCTRILGPITRQPFTFAALEVGQESAAGQLTAKTLLDVYRFRELNSQTQVFGLLGHPVDKSVSHLTHNAVFNYLNKNAVYVKFDVQVEELDSFFEKIYCIPIAGLSVTMPHKERVQKWMNSLSNEGPNQAYNTLFFTEKGIEGCNTDGRGAIKTLGVQELSQKKMIILGAGGTAQAIAREAKKLGAELIILNRTLIHAQKLAQQFDSSWGGLEKLASLACEGYDILVQATSVGMAPHFDAMPISSDWIYPGADVLDVISNPQETKLLREAHLKGCRTYRGIDLFVYQAVEQFVYWCGAEVDPVRIEHVIRQHLPSLSPAKKSVKVRKSLLNGSISLPPSKSHSIRAVLLGAMADGTTRIRHLLHSPDVLRAVQAASQLGARVQSDREGLTIVGVKGQPKVPDEVIDAGNSGQVLRFVGALAALSGGYTVITGDHSIRSNRSIQPLIEGVKSLGGWAASTRQNGYAPLIIKGPIQSGRARLEGQDSQPVSALLMAAAFVEGVTEIQVHQAGEKPWIALTLSWLDRLGVAYTHQNFEHFVVYGQRLRPSFNLTIPGDFSSAAFLLVAALITQSELTIQNVDMDDVQGDKEVIFLLQKMGARLSIDCQRRCLSVHKGSKLKGQVIDVNPFIDAVPILAVMGCFAEGETQLINGSIARHKECNRLRCMTAELKKMGAKIEETEDGLRVQHSPLKGAKVNSYEDHRVALSLVVAGLGAEGETEVEDVECMQKSYPTFIEEMKNLGAHVCSATT